MSDQVFKSEERAYYSYCYHLPSRKHESPPPIILFMNGRGSRGKYEDLEYLYSDGGVGELVHDYINLNNREEANKLAAEEFLTVFPISLISDPETGEGLYHYWPDKILDVLSDVSKKHSFDWGRVYIVGYSMGGRGTWRFITAYPEIAAAAVISAGVAERKGDFAMTEQPAPETIPLLYKIVDLPIKTCIGTKDQLTGTTGARQVQEQIVRQGGKKSELIWVHGADHGDMGTAPFTGETLKWLLEQKKMLYGKL